MRYAIAFGCVGFSLIALAAREVSEPSGGDWVFATIEAHCALCSLTIALIYGLKQACVDVEARLNTPGWAILLVHCPSSIFGLIRSGSIRQGGWGRMPQFLAAKGNWGILPQPPFTLPSRFGEHDAQGEPKI